MAYKEYREMKVYEQSGYNYKPTPTIVLKGKWLEELGFGSGTPVVVKSSHKENRKEQSQSRRN